MKTFEVLGSFILYTRWGMFFGCFLLISILGLGAWVVISSPQTITISAKDFYCTEAEPWGIGSRCITLHRK
jgi:hypothetical protein